MIAAFPLASRAVAAIALFVVHMVLAFFLMTMTSTPVAMDVPGLKECPVTDLGGYDPACLDRNDRRIRQYMQTHPVEPDYRLRDGVGIALGVLVGIGLAVLVGRDAVRRRYVLAAYLLPFMLGILRPLAALAWLAAFLAVVWLLGRKDRRTSGAGTPV